MAVCWRCPSCSEVSCEDDVNLTGPISCDHCHSPFEPNQTLCTICDTPNPWARRDSIHFWCRECGTMQRFFSFRIAAG